jgi:hypothetical protein
VKFIEYAAMSPNVGQVQIKLVGNTEIRRVKITTNGKVQTHVIISFDKRSNGQDFCL